MKKVTLSGLLIVLLSLCSFAVRAYDLKKTNLSTCYYNILYTESGSFAYNSDGNMEMELTYKDENYNSYSGTLHVHEYAAYSATKYCYCMGIGDSACYDCSELTKVVFNKASLITYIGKSAFQNCSSLTTLDLSSTNITTIGDYAFFGCSDLEEIDLPSTVTSIGASAFAYCHKLKTIKLPSTVTSLGENAFCNCESLTSVSGLGSTTITSIPYGAFWYCSALTSIDIPSTVTRMGKYAFYNCTSLQSVNGLENTTMIEIPNYAFTSCTVLNSITLPSTIQSIGISAFDDCNALASINIPSAVLAMGKNAFYNCTSLTSINIPSSLVSLDAYVFAYCSALETVSGWENSSIKNIGNHAFYGCTKLPSTLKIPNTITGIGEAAFGDCTNLTDVTYNAPSITSAGSSDNPPFYGCKNLEKVTIGDGVTTIPDNLFDGKYSNNFPKLTSIEIPSSVTSIGDYAFFYCTSLAEAKINGSNLTSIGSCAFAGCYSLTSIPIPSSVTTINESAFGACYALTSIVLPKNLTSIGPSAFYNCKALESIYSYAVTPPIPTGSYVFSNVPSSCVLYVPAGAEKAYGGYSSYYTKNWSSLETVRTFHLLDVVAKSDPDVEGNTEGYGYMTFYNGDYTFTLPEGMTATTVSGMDDDGSLKMDWEYSAGDIIPANTAVILYGKVDEFMAMVDYTSDTSTKYGTIEDGTAPETNWLYGVWSTDDLYTDEDYTDGVVFAYDEDGNKTTDGYLFYTLNYDSIDDETGVYKDIGFYWSAEDGGPFSIAAKKAWLAIPTDAANGAKFSTFLFGDNGETTGIKAINNTSSDDVRTGDGVIYNMAGQRVNDMNQRGIYIVNGRKVVKK